MKYIFIIFTILMAISCNNTNNCSNNNSTIEYEEIYCPKCDGIGEVKADVGTRIVMDIMTMCTGALVETTECDMCDGTGIVKRRKLNNKK